MQQETSLPQKFANRDYPTPPPECNKIKHRPTRLKSYIHPILSLLDTVAEVGNISWRRRRKGKRRRRRRKQERKKERIRGRSNRARAIQPLHRRRGSTIEDEFIMIRFERVARTESRGIVPQNARRWFPSLFPFNLLQLWTIYDIQLG